MTTEATIAIIAVANKIVESGSLLSECVTQCKTSSINTNMFITMPNMCK